MITYEAAKLINPIKLLESMGLKSYYKDKNFEYFQVIRDVTELGLKYKKTIELRLMVGTVQNGYYVFTYLETILYLPEVVAMIRSETMNLPTTNAAISAALAFIESVECDK